MDRHWADLMFASIRKSVQTYAAEISLWISFCAASGVSPLGPVVGTKFAGASEETALRFLGLFRNGRSAGKYLTAVRALHDFARAPCTELSTRAIHRALAGAQKLTPPPHHAFALRRIVVRRVTDLAWLRNENDTALMGILAYNFGFRVGDELMPLCWDDPPNEGHSSCTFTSAPNGRPLFTVSLRSRKNEPYGAELTRPCTCPPWQRDSAMCPVHSVRRWLLASRRLARGRFFPGNPFSNQRSFMRRFSDLGRRLQERGFDVWTSQGFRRGMAQDILESGGSVANILKAGGWRSSAFLLYLERAQVDEVTMLDCIFAHDAAADSEALKRLPPTVRALLAPLPDGARLGVPEASPPAIMPARPLPAAPRPAALVASVAAPRPVALAAPVAAAPEAPVPPRAWPFSLGSAPSHGPLKRPALPAASGPSAKQAPPVLARSPEPAGPKAAKKRKQSDGAPAAPTSDSSQRSIFAFFPRDGAPFPP